MTGGRYSETIDVCTMCGNQFSADEYCRYCKKRKSIVTRSSRKQIYSIDEKDHILDSIDRLIKYGGGTYPEARARSAETLRQLRARLDNL